MNLCTRLIDLQNSSLLQWCDLDEVYVQLLLALVTCFRRHQQHKRTLSGVSQYWCGFPTLFFIGTWQSIAAGIGTSNFPRTAFMVSLNSASLG